MEHHLCPDWIQFNVPQTGEEIRITVNEGCTIASFPRGKRAMQLTVIIHNRRGKIAESHLIINRV